MLPFGEERFVDAVRAGGGTVAPLDQSTSGLVWELPDRSDDLAAILAAHPGIEWVQLPWAGVDGFAGLLAEQARGTRVLWTSAKGTFSEPVAEHAVALTLALLRRLQVKSASSSWAAERVGTSLYGRNVVILGAGGIAVEVMRLLAPFRVTTTVVRRRPDPLPGAHRTVTADRLRDVLPDADVVVLAAASTRGTARMMRAPEFAAMKPSAVLVNVGRGALVDTDALVAALDEGLIDGAALDVTDPEPLPDGHPLWSSPRCLITSHSADTIEMTAPLLAARITANVDAFLHHRRLTGVVDPGAGY